MNNNLRNTTGMARMMAFVVSNPVLSLVIGLIILVFFITATVLIATGGTQYNGMSKDNRDTVYVNCAEGKIDTDKFTSKFENAGVFTGLSDIFLSEGAINQVDPVLLAAIALHETGNGTSHAVEKYNNPGGLIDPNTGHLMKFDTLHEGLDKMASNLYKNYISQGLVTIPQIGSKYAPIGAENDPTGLNLNWVPDIIDMANDLGGLSMNCKAVGEGSGEYILPVGNVPITSPFGYRIDPITGIQTEFHKGVDFGAKLGTVIYSAQGGTVKVAVTSGWGGGYGEHVVIDTGDKLDLYGHMSEVFVKVGQHVEQGQAIGEVGQTGSATGPHLHFEVQLSLYGERIDPMPFFEPKGG